MGVLHKPRMTLAAVAVLATAAFFVVLAISATEIAVDWSIFCSVILSVALNGSFLTLYLDHRLQIERDKRNESLEHRQKIRDASAAVVNILAEWTRTTYMGEAFDGAAKWRLQTAYWRNILLLDKELLDLLRERLANHHAAVDTNEIIVQARRILLELKEPDISAKDLNVWK